MTYQSHDGVPGISNSARKLERLKLPADLSGKRVLDLGCNEGFFCAEAARRGAEVVGIDANEKNIAFARNRYPDKQITFLQQSWRSLPQGPFDVVLWLSAMHYERDPTVVFASLKQVITPGGLLVLECGTHPDKNLDYLVPTQRPGDVRFYPSNKLLVRAYLRGWAVRVAAPPELTPGDPIPRSVFHCRPAKATVLLITGKSERGKSSLARLIRSAPTKTIPLDGFLWPFQSAKTQPTPFAQFVKENLSPKALETFFQKLDDAGHTDTYVDLLAATVAPSDEFVVIEGFMTEKQQTALKERLKKFAIVWEATRS